MKFSTNLITLLFSIATTLAQQYPGGSLSSSSSSASSTNALYSDFGVLDFANFGFEGYYKHVKTLDSSDTCACKLADNSDRTIFKGSNAPLNEEVSIHFRGPLILSKYGYYVSDQFNLSSTSSSSSKTWERLSYYDGASQTSENVTFLTHAGSNSSCLGAALSYAASDGISSASSSTILANDTLIASDDEFIIFSNITCGSSGFGKDCGVYRDGIPAYHGFYGTTKMFLFEFEMPEETSDDEDSFEFYNLPAIWLLNANIPRTSQYPSNENCSCWATGCGEFDIFEVMNQTEATHFYSTIHDYQGTGDIGTGLQNHGWIQREYGSVMKGGVVFGTDGTVAVFLSNSTSIDSTISGSDLLGWISTVSEDDGVVTSTLVSATNTGSGKVNGGANPVKFDLDMRYILTIFAIVGAISFI
ncbi:hypothetical protein WICMUC_001095 [Wickerhamomyces mucosus]|uniref:glucan endo-1,3-beta-D-glucosidase n=1 Tax=Wickerhamomyces mucosus TaxID=1378264 RepID=A0A9P8PVV4_9ASCO|nr:hypothetical protein WICMUC_001095 [Wickerhamomyces mucosus]